MAALKKNLSILLLEWKKIALPRTPQYSFCCVLDQTTRAYLGLLCFQSNGGNYRFRPCFASVVDSSLAHRIIRNSTWFRNDHCRFPGFIKSLLLSRETLNSCGMNGIFWNYVSCDSIEEETAVTHVMPSRFNELLAPIECVATKVIARGIKRDWSS